jgi:glycosyltransferase involved in cell wall biosynthesis
VRIALIAPPRVPIPPPAYGGTEAVLDVLARGLQAAGHDVLLYATGDSTCPVPTAWTFPTARGVELDTPATELVHVRDAYEVARDVDVVHDHTLVDTLGPQRAAHVPVVTTNHGPFDPQRVGLYRSIADRVGIIAISHDQASRARDVPVVAVIHHGLDVAEYPAGRGDGGYALFLGRMSPDKGVHVAAGVARAAGIPLLIAAKMRERAEHDYFVEHVRPLLGDGTDYIGEVCGPAKRELLGSAACLLNPIAWPEPFGMVMIEALACGTPIIGTPCGAAPEIVDEGVTGFLRSGRDALTDALAGVAYLDRAACRLAVKQRFSSERMVADHVAVYEEVVDGSRF